MSLSELLLVRTGAAEDTEVAFIKPLRGPRGFP
jgi:hypothetical protein